ncbi:unnamed protein product, partial [Prunus brigantina]
APPCDLSSSSILISPPQNLSHRHHLVPDLGDYKMAFFFLGQNRPDRPDRLGGRLAPSRRLGLFFEHCLIIRNLRRK